MIAALLFGVAMAGEPNGLAPASDTAATYRSHLTQAQFFAKRGWSADALAELETALATPEGQQSWEAHWLGARLAWDLCDLDRAFGLGRAAAALAPDTEREAPTAFVAGLERDMGFAVLDAPYPGMTSRMQLELLGMLFDPELAAYVDRLAVRLRSQTALPMRVGLPAGLYKINGIEFTVAVSDEARLVLPMEAIGRRGLTALQVSRLELGFGTGIWIGERMGDLLPAARASLGFTLPAGQLLMGPVVEASLQSYLAEGQVLVRPLGWSAGARIGTEVFLGGPLAVRPSLLFRYGQIPGIPLNCTEEASAWLCSIEPPERGPVHRVYAAGRGIMPGAELLVEYREAGRTTALGTGVRIAVDYARGNLGTEGSAWDEGNNEYTWHTTDSTWSAIGFSMLANVGVAF